MKTMGRFFVSAGLLLGIATALINAVGCSRSAEALEVTYYYLPG